MGFTIPYTLSLSFLSFYGFKLDLAVCSSHIDVLMIKLKHKEKHHDVLFIAL